MKTTLSSLSRSLPESRETPSANLAFLTAGRFSAAQTPMTESEEIAQLMEALKDDTTMAVDQDGTIHMDQLTTGNQQNMTVMPKGTFALTESEEIAQLMASLQDQDSSMGLTQDGTVTLSDEQGLLPQNVTEMPKGTFAAEQWYKKNPVLFHTEVSLMQKRFPTAQYRILQDGGAMVWVIKLNISKTGFCAPWTFMLRYEPDHPNNHSYGGSIRVIPLSPTLDEIRKRARDAGRPGVPHLVHGKYVDGKEYTFLCTRRGEDVHDGETKATSAAQTATWAADWALHFELGLRDKTVWNNWCNDQHFKHLMI